jgi:hypothetical protein
VWQELDFGLPAGNTYYPADLVLDAGQGLVYALGTCMPELPYTSEWPKGCISVLDLGTDRVLRTVQAPSGYFGRLLPAGDALYLHYPLAGDLYMLDRETLAVTQAISDVLAVAYDGDEATYAMNREAIMRLSPDPLTMPVETPFDDAPVEMAASADQVYVLGYRSLRAWSPELALRATFDLTEEGPRTLALDTARGWLFVGCRTGLYVLNTETMRWIESPPGDGSVSFLPGVQRLILDPTGARLWAITHRSMDWFGGSEVVAVDIGPSAEPSSWREHTLLSTLEGSLLGLVLDQENDRLLVTSYEDQALIPLVLSTGDVAPRLPLGSEVSEVIVDEVRGRLYVSDSAGWVRVLDRRTYAELDRVFGGRYISLGGSQLYAGDARVPVVTVFDASAGGELRVAQTIPQPGKPRADPAASQVVIVNRSFYVFDVETTGAGTSIKPAGKWLPYVGQPPEGCSGCYYTIAQEIAIDARRGLTATTTYTPWPGKPGPDESITYDPASGLAYYALLTGGYMHYSSIATYRDLGAFQEREDPILHLEGLSGDIQLDPVAQQLYVARANMLFVLDSETLNRIGRLYTEDWQPTIAAVDGDLGRLYTPRQDKLVVWTRQGEALPPALPAEPAIVTGAVTSILPSPAFVRDHTLLATIDGRLCRSKDGGQTWEGLRGGLPVLNMFGPSDGYRYSANAAFSPAYAEDKTIWAGIYLGDSHGEGVYRSSDSGDTWQPSSVGLYDLRVQRVVPSPNFGQDRTLLAYARTSEGEALYRSTNGGDSWNLVLRQTSYDTPPLPRPEEWFGVTGPPQFRCDFQGTCERSNDGGETWAPLDTDSVQLDRLVAYAVSPQFESDGIVYFVTQANLYRYQEHEGIWSICTLPVFGNRDYTNALASLATAATGEDEHALFVGSNAGEFMRFAARELPWNQVWPVPTPPPPTATPCPQGVDARFELDVELPHRLGCPAGPGQEVQVAFQPFERGAMFWRGDVRQVIVLQEDNTWSAYEDTWQEGQPERDPDLVPPAGLYQPIRGFGKVWREELGGKAAQIGWATAQERGFSSVIQPFAQGFVLRGRDGLLYLFFTAGTWETLRP